MADVHRPALPALTSLRFLAALWVAVFHMRAMRTFMGPEWFQNVASFGYMGVNFFFVLSGFILVYSYWGRITSARVFWQTRFARIYPVLAFSLLLTAPGFFYVCLKLDVAKLTPEWVWCAAHLKLSALLTVLMLQTWIPAASMSWHMPTWSISNEAFFYFLFPFLLPRFGHFTRRQLAAVIAGGLAFGVAATLIHNRTMPDGALTYDPRQVVPWRYFTSFNPLMRLSEFLMGMAAGFLFLKNNKNRRYAWPLLVGGVGLVVLMAATMHVYSKIVVQAAVVAPCFVAIIYGVALRPAGLMAWLENRFSVLLGDASYSYYLLHSLVIAGFMRYFQDASGNLKHQTWPALLMVLVTIAVFAILSYRFIEQPLRRKLRPKGPVKSAVAAPDAAIAATGSAS